MKYTPQEIIQFCEEEDVKFIRLAFCDIYGHQKNTSIMPSELPRAFKTGVSFDASSIQGFDLDSQSDLLLHPSPDTLSILPWRPEHGRVVRMYCSVTYPDGRPFERDCRTLLINAIDAAAKDGLNFSFGTEMSFYLFNLDENGYPTKDPYDHGTYLDIAPADKGENVRREICLTLEKMGITPETSHHEAGPGQNEISFRYADALTAADNAVTFRSVVQTIASRNGLYADFAPKPIPHQPGSGFHIDLSVSGPGRNSGTLDEIKAGILDSISEMTVFLNPLEESYQRLGHHKVSRYITWSHLNRTALIRVPSVEGTEERLELRSPDSAANPYLAFTLLIYAALHGIHDKPQIPDQMKENVFRASKETLAKFDTLPESLDIAKATAKSSSLIRNILPDLLIKAYTE